VAAHLSEWTSDVTNNYEESELYDELLSVWSRYIGHVVTNVGGVHEDIKSLIKGSRLYGSFESTTARSDAVVAN
jgi:hypothetical protein